MIDEKEELFTLDVKMYTTELKVELKDCTDCENEYEVKQNRAVALIGDAFYHGAFLPATELEKAHKGWENTLHDFNHQGTTDARGLMISANILYFVGYNSNVTFDEKTKKMSMQININNNTHYASAWRGYVELCEESGQTPNVSVAFMAKTKSVKASDLPAGIDYAAHGYGEDDTVAYIYDIKPQALSTVFQGACDDKQGCGIGKCQVEEEEEVESPTQEEIDALDKKRDEIIQWLKNHDKEE